MGDYSKKKSHFKKQLRKKVRKMPSLFWFIAKLFWKMVIREIPSGQHLVCAWCSGSGPTYIIKIHVVRWKQTLPHISCGNVAVDKQTLVEYYVKYAYLDELNKTFLIFTLSILWSVWFCKKCPFVFLVHAQSSILVKCSDTSIEPWNNPWADTFAVFEIIRKNTRFQMFLECLS